MSTVEIGTCGYRYYDPAGTGRRGTRALLAAHSSVYDAVEPNT